MVSFVKNLAALAFVAAPWLVTAVTLRMFPDSGCNSAGYYRDFQVSETSCSGVDFSDSDFKQDSGDPSQYDAYLEVLESPGDGCAVVLAHDSTDAQNPPCGECEGSFMTANKCFYQMVPQTVYLNVCCGSDCETQCASVPGKRSVNTTTVDADALKRNPAALKSSSPLASKKAKRADCTFNKDGDLFSIVGNPVAVSNTFQPCPNDNGCSQMYSGTVESSFSQTFGVSESTEAGFFDIVSETVSFSYDATYEKSQSVSVSGSYTYNKGQSGYMTFSPLSQCNKGTFSGADCSGMGIPIGGDSRQACVPETIDGGQPRGDINVVTTE